VGASATTPVINWLLKGLENDDTACLDGLNQLIARNHQMVLPILLDTLCNGAGPPWASAAQIHGLACVANVL